MSDHSGSAEQEKALARLVAEGTLDAGQAQAVRSALWGSAAGRGRSTSPLIEVAGYVGGGLMLGGAGLLMSLSWRQLERGQAIGLLLAIAVVLVIAGTLVAGGPHRVLALRSGSAPARRRLVGVLFTLSAVPAAFAASASTGDHATLIGSSVGLVVAAGGYALLPTVSGLLMTAAMSLIATFGLLEPEQPDKTLERSFAIIVLGLLWAAVSLVRLVTPKHIGLAVAAAFTILGAQLALGEKTNLWAYALTFAAAVGCFALYWWERTTVLLAAGVVASTLAVPEAISDWTNGALSGPAILLIAGAALVGASALGLRLRGPRRTKPPAPNVPPDAGDKRPGEVG
ncbi:MAG: hypothetical protein QOE61_5377 [Micromonosporaceae bacterium]|nr:hypothetical protein [Micromonosporaceae bacterium]